MLKEMLLAAAAADANFVVWTCGTTEGVRSCGMAVDSAVRHDYL